MCYKNIYSPIITNITIHKSDPITHTSAGLSYFTRL